MGTYPVTDINRFDLRNIGVYEGRFNGLGQPVGWFISNVFSKNGLPRDLLEAVESGKRPLLVTKLDVQIYGLSCLRLQLIRSIAIAEAMEQTAKLKVQIFKKMLDNMDKPPPLFDQ